MLNYISIAEPIYEVIETYWQLADNIKYNIGEKRGKMGGEEVFIKRRVAQRRANFVWKEPNPAWPAPVIK